MPSCSFARPDRIWQQALTLWQDRAASRRGRPAFSGRLANHAHHPSRHRLPIRSSPSLRRQPADRGRRCEGAGRLRQWLHPAAGPGRPFAGRGGRALRHPSAQRPSGRSLAAHGRRLACRPAAAAAGFRPGPGAGPCAGVARGLERRARAAHGLRAAAERRGAGRRAGRDRGRSDGGDRGAHRACRRGGPPPGRSGTGLRLRGGRPQARALRRHAAGTGAGRCCGRLRPAGPRGVRASRLSADRRCALGGHGRGGGRLPYALDRCRRDRRGGTAPRRCCSPTSCRPRPTRRRCWRMRGPPMAGRSWSART